MKLFKHWKAVLPLCLALILIACMGVSMTGAFFQAQTNTVTNTFTAGQITYTLNLEANAKNANHNYEDTLVEMPTELAPQATTALSVGFTPDKDPVLTGYTFEGWYYDANCTQEYTGITGQTITVKYGDANDLDDDPNKVEITVYAKWEPTTYEIIYDGNTATSGAMENSKHTYDEAANLSENLYKKEGYTFDGWNTAADGSGHPYADKEQVANLSNDGTNVTLYAQWKATTYEVAYHGNGSTAGSMSNSKHTYDKESNLSANQFTKTGYLFDGWNTAEDGSGTAYTDAQAIMNLSKNGETIDLYAQWKPITYTVVYHKNDQATGDTQVTPATGTTANSTHTFDVAKKLTENGYTRVGYTFIGWNTKADGTGDYFGNKDSVINLTTVPNDTVNLYAQWGVKSYIIRYHANGGTGSMADQAIKYDIPTVLSANAFTKNDYTFYGWALTTNGEVKYIDKQTVVNLQESGILDLYAVWVQNTHTVTFDYNGGTGSPESKEVLNGKAYGVLPEYPVHPTKKVSDDKIMTYLFTGWYTSKTGGTRVYPETMVNRTDDHTLYAHWEEAPSNNVIQNMVVKNNPDDNKDGVVDDIYLEFTCTSTFEKYNIPLKNLVPGQTYKLKYTASNDASFGDYVSGYKNSVYGSYIMSTDALTGGRIENNYDETEYVAQVLADWNSRKEADGNNDGSHAAINDSMLQGPWKNKEIVFTAKAATMYWTWDFGLIEDNIQNNYNITDIVLEPVVPKFDFANKTVLRPGASVAKIVSQTNGTYDTTFTFDGDSGCETLYYKITGLTAGTTYTITFDHTYSGNFVNTTQYDYGCGIMNAAPAATAMGSRMSNLGAFASNTYICTATDTKSVTLTFTATGAEAYWVWNMANCSDSTNGTTTVTIRSFSAKHAAGGNITYYQNGSISLLAMRPAKSEQLIVINPAEDSEPMDTEPVVIDPVETEPEETEPEVTDPEETVPEETVPEETVPEETVPEETEPEETPVEAPPAETDPALLPENNIDGTKILTEEGDE